MYLKYQEGQSANNSSAQATEKGKEKGNCISIFNPPIWNKKPSGTWTIAEVAEYIKSCGLYKTKAADIVNMCKKLRDDFGGRVPDKMEELLSLSGVGRKTANGLLGCCTTVSAAEAKPGDLIFFQGTYETSGASHVGIYVGDGMMLHCGNPIQYTSVNSSYWQDHFYTYGRLND